MEINLSTESDKLIRNETEAIECLKSNKPTSGYVMLQESIDIAIQALEKQIPKKVKIEQWIYTKCDCGFEFSKHHGDGYYSIPIENKTKYCPYCGQKLDWSDEE